MSLLFQPRRWFSSGAVFKFQKEFVDYLYGEQNDIDQTRVMCFYNARSALFHGLQSLGVSEGDRVAVQGYTCVSVINAIKATGAEPVYVDIKKEDLNMDPEELVGVLEEYRGTIKVVIVQHTLGIVSPVSAIQHLCDQYGSLLLEDCAHALGAEYDGKKVGTFGDVSIFSFGRDKIVSSVNGGVLLINNDQFRSYLDSIEPIPISVSLLLKNLIYAIKGYISYLSYDFLKLGKVSYYLLGKLRLFPLVVASDEKQCQNTNLSYAMPGALALLARQEVENIDRYNDHRRSLAKLYADELGSKFLFVERGSADTKDVYLRTVYLSNEDGIVSDLKKKGVYVGDWYQQVIAPNDVDQSAIGYEKGTCPVAEKVANQTINLPNGPLISKADLGIVIESIKNL